MKLYEYEGKELFKKMGIPVPQGTVVTQPVEIPGKKVVKVQLLEGGRGKRGLVRVTEDVKGAISELKSQGFNKFLIEDFVPHSREVYLSAMIDRDSMEPMIVASPNGGVDVEKQGNAKTFLIPEERGIKDYDIYAIEKYLDARGLGAIVKGIYRILLEYEAELVEINPLALSEGSAIALDSKVILEDNAIFRHEDLVKSLGREHSGDNYVELEGDIGLAGNGAGLTMATMDLIKLMGGSPANFLDIGGGGDREKTRQSILRVLSNPKVKKVVVNIFGGITRCDEAALGIVEAYKLSPKPVYVRMVGNKQEEGRKILQENGIKVYDDVRQAIGDALRS